MRLSDSTSARIVGVFLLMMAFVTFQASAPMPDPGLVPIVATDGGAVRLEISVPATAASETPVPVTVTARSADGTVASGYRGTVRLTSTDADATVPADYTFTEADAGGHRFEITFGSAGSYDVTATDTVSLIGAGRSSLVVSAPADARPAVALDVSSPATSAPGTPVPVTVTARSADGNVATGYRGTVRFISTDAAATLPADYTFTEADAGRHRFDFGVVLATLGTQQLTATDSAAPSVNGSSGAIAVSAFVSAQAVASLDLSLPAAATVGTPSTLTVRAQDSSGAVDPSYRGTVSFTSTDAAATLPPDYTFTEADAGQHVFQVTFATAGSQEVTATDTTTASITGQSEAVTVSATAASTTTSTSTTMPTGTSTSTSSTSSTSTSTSSTTTTTGSTTSTTLPPTCLTAPVTTSAPCLAVDLGTATTAVVGAAVSFTVRALDVGGQIDTDYTGTVHFTSTDPTATLPPDYTFLAADQGEHVFTPGVVFATPGNQTVTATDAEDGDIAGVSSSIAVTASPAVEPGPCVETGPGESAAEVVPASVAPGATVTVQNQQTKCFASETELTITLTPGPVELGLATSSADGRYSTIVTIPAGTALGVYQITVVGEGAAGGTHISTAEVTVAQAEAPGSPSGGTGDGALPSTGSSTGRLTMAGVLALAGGLVLKRAGQPGSAGRSRPAAG